MLPHEIEKVKRRLDAIIGSEELTKEFRRRYATDFRMIRACIDENLIKSEAVQFIMELTRGKVEPKKTYKATITFEYDADELAPLTNRELKHPDDVIDQVRDELEQIPASEFVIEAMEYIDGELNFGVKG